MGQRGVRLPKDFPVIKPQASQYGLLDLLHNAKSDEIRRAAKSKGYRNETDLLLVEPLPSPSSPQKNEALGLFYVGESSRRFGFKVNYWDARHEDEEKLWKRVAESNIVGFTAITGYQLLQFVRLATEIKKQWPEKPIILGGAHATLTKPEVNLSDPLVDFIVVGEGELRMPSLLMALYTGTGMEMVDGIGYKRDDEIVFQPPTHVPDPAKGHLVRAVSQWTLPYFLTAAARNEMILPTSRGCPWSPDSCDFCSVGKQYMDSYRGYPFDLWQADILEIHQRVPVKHLEPEDENSALAIKPNQPYLPFLKSIGATSHLHLRSDQLKDPAKVKWLAEMGVKRIHIGIESGNERVLNQVMHKNERVMDHVLAAQNMAAAKIEMVATYIVANPTETWSEMKDTLTLAEQLEKIMPPKTYRATIYVLAALPGTPIYHAIERMHEFNNILDAAEQILQHNNPELTGQMLADLARWYRLPFRAEASSTLPEKLLGLCKQDDFRHPKVADTAQSALADFLCGTGSFEKLREETKKWLWPKPGALRDWTQISAAYNPNLPEHVNAIYPFGGLRFNRHHKTAQNFPGWKRVLIAPFEILARLRYRLRYFRHSSLELRLIGKIINWAAQRSIGDNLDSVHARKVFENYSETLAGH